VIYIFADETYPASEKIRFSCVSVLQSYFTTEVPRVAHLARQGKSARRNLVEDLLREGNYRTVITDLDMVKALSPLETPDALSQKGDMSARDNLWSHAFGYSIAYAVRLACQAWAFDTVDVFHDPKSLTPAHEGVLRDKLREVENRLASAEVAKVYPALRGRIRIRRIEAVPKPGEGKEYTKFQEGTWLAHWASRLSEPERLAEENENFLHRDLTPILIEVVKEMIRKERQHGVG
jgi:hypothetical protein